jgi:hypothetical protein
MPGSRVYYGTEDDVRAISEAVVREIKRWHPQRFTWYTPESPFS